jgi:hypothetical protein
MHNPYIVGGWVRGPNFYGYTELIDDLLNGAADAYWVVSPRRGGKTSLLKEMELLTVDSSRYVPLYWNLEGLMSREALSGELCYAVEDNEERFSAIGISADDLDCDDFRSSLRFMAKKCRERGKKLLLLIDEPEVLIKIGTDEPETLALFRKTLQGTEGLRTILASTRLLLTLSTPDEAPTSPFLYGFVRKLLGPMNRGDAEDLMRQSKMPVRVEVARETADAIHEATGDQPYLLQSLCFRLFEPDGYLRHPTDEDLIPIDIVAENFLLNWRFMSPKERKMLLAIAQHEPASEEQLSEILGFNPYEVKTVLFSLHVYGFLKLENGRYSLQNHLLRNWINSKAYRTLLENTTETLLNDSETEELVREVGESEVKYLFERLMAAQKDLLRLQERKELFAGYLVPLPMLRQIEEKEKEIDSIVRSLNRLESLSTELKALIQETVKSREPA